MLFRSEAGDGEDGRIKSAIGIGTLLEDGIGDTVRVSLTEDPEFEIPVCKDLIHRYGAAAASTSILPEIKKLTYDPFNYKRRETISVQNIGSSHVPVVIADFSKYSKIVPEDFDLIGYHYDAETDKWNISDTAADYVYCNSEPEFNLPGTLKVLLDAKVWSELNDKEKAFPLFDSELYLKSIAACNPRYAEITIANTLIVSTNIVTNGIVIDGAGTVKNKIKTLAP